VTIRCFACGLPIPDPGEDNTSWEALLCDACLIAADHPVFKPCGEECDGLAGDDVDPDYYCKAGNPWMTHDEV